MKIKSNINYLLIVVAVLAFVLFKTAKGYEVDWNAGIKFLLSFTVLLSLCFGLIKIYIPKLFEGNRKQFVVIPMLILLAFVLLELIWCYSRIHDYYQRYYMFFSWAECIRPTRIAGVEHNSILIGLISGVAFSFVLVFIDTFLSKLKSGLKIRNKLKLFATVILVIICGALVKLIVTDTFKSFEYNNEITNPQIDFQEVSNNISSIEDIIKECKLDNKPTYVSFWTNGAWLKYPVILELEYLKTDSIKQNVNFLYIRGQAVSFPSDEESWKQQIDSYSITGTHVYLSKRQFEKVFVDTYKAKNGVAFGYSMFFDRNAILKMEKAPVANKREKSNLEKLLISTF